MAARASLDLANGHLQLAERRVPVTPLENGGRWQLHGPGGPVLRSPTFGERTRLVVASFGSADPALALAGALVAALREGSESGDATAERVLALLLAGGGASAPPLVESACLVARASATPLSAVEALDAAQVDFYASGLADEEPEDGGWQRVVLSPTGTGGRMERDASVDEQAIMRELADTLLVRARGGASANTRALAAGRSANDTAMTDERFPARLAQSPMETLDSTEPTPRHALTPTVDGSDHGVARPATTAIDAASGASGAVSLEAAATPPAPPLMRYRQRGSQVGTMGSRVGASAARARSPERVAPSATEAGAATSRPVPVAGALQPIDAGRSRLGSAQATASDAPPGAPSWSAAAGEQSPSPVPDVLGGVRMLPAAPSAAAPTARPHAASPDELSDLVAEALRLEATRRGLVP